MSCIQNCKDNRRREKPALWIQNSWLNWNTTRPIKQGRPVSAEALAFFFFFLLRFFLLAVDA
jgi:hypothetical protein